MHPLIHASASTVLIGRGVSNPAGRPVECQTLDELGAVVCVPPAIDLVYSELSKRDQAWVALGEFEFDYRKIEHHRWSLFLGFDFDHVTTPVDWPKVARVLGARLLWHTTYSHSMEPTGKGCYRVFVQLSEPVNTTQHQVLYRILSDALRSELGITVDSTCKDPARLFFFGKVAHVRTTSGDRDHDHDHDHGFAHGFAGTNDPGVPSTLDIDACLARRPELGAALDWDGPGGTLSWSRERGVTDQNAYHWSTWYPPRQELIQLLSEIVGPHATANYLARNDELAPCEAALAMVMGVICPDRGNRHRNGILASAILCDLASPTGDVLAWDVVSGLFNEWGSRFPDGPQTLDEMSMGSEVRRHFTEMARGIARAIRSYVTERQDRARVRAELGPPAGYLYGLDGKPLWAFVRPRKQYAEQPATVPGLPLARTAGRPAIVAGGAGSGKTTAMVTWALCELFGRDLTNPTRASGGGAFGRSRWLFIDAENGERQLMGEILVPIAKDMGIKEADLIQAFDDGRLSVLSDPITARGDGQPRLQPLRFDPNGLEIITGLAMNYDVVVVDTLAATLPIGLDENDAGDMTTYMMGLRQLSVETGAQVIVLHHMGKARGAKGPDISPRGSSALLGSASSVLAWTAEKDGSRKLTVTKGDNHVPLTFKKDGRLIQLQDNSNDQTNAAEALDGRATTDAQRAADESLYQTQLRAVAWYVGDRLDVGEYNLTRNMAELKGNGVWAKFLTRAQTRGDVGWDGKFIRVLRKPEAPRELFSPPPAPPPPQPQPQPVETKP